MNDELHRSEHEEEEDLFFPAEEEELFLPAEEENLPGRAGVEPRRQDVSRPPKSKGRPKEEEDLFFPAEEEELFPPAEEEDLQSRAEVEPRRQDVSRPPRSKGRPKEEELFPPAEEEDLQSRVEGEPRRQDVSQPRRSKGKPPRPPRSKSRLSRWKLVGVGVAGLLVLALVLLTLSQTTGKGIVQTKSSPVPSSTEPAREAVPTPKGQATAGPTSLTSGPLILLNPGVVRQGTQVSVTGTGFPPKATIDLVLKRQTGGQSLASAFVQADKTGSFGGATLQVPTSLSSGTFVVQATARGSAQVAQAVGTIAGGTPRVKLGVQVAQPGDLIVFSLHGFSPGESINIYWNTMGGQPVATVHADGGGGVGQATVQVPYGAVGPNTFLFVGSTSQALTAATIELLALYPTVTLSSYALRADSAMSFTGKGFGPSERVLVYLNNPNDAPVAVLQTDAKGTFSKAGNFVIPFSLKGKQTLVFLGEQSRTPSVVAFAVQPYTPTIQPSTYGGFPGTTVSFYATGFARNEVVHVYVGGTRNGGGTMVSCFSTDDKGNAGAAGSYVIPGNAQVGKLVFTLIGSKSGGVGTATMQVAAPPAPVQVPAQPPFTCTLDPTPSPTAPNGP